MGLEDKTVKELLQLNSNTLYELKKREIVRTSNKPTGDLAEYLFCKSYNWIQSHNSQAGYDASDNNGRKYQIKGRQILKAATRVPLSAIRNLDDKNFDFIAVVIFDANYNVTKAAIIPHEIICASNPRYSKHDNKHTFYIADEYWTMNGVEDATDKLKAYYDTI